ncbi:MAG: pyrroloquinoline quinone-dependent dehydrogenase [Bacteroidetes bacterium]|nr:MAG: pyrroloquinoline quinone-dependent dehydrogenase [Bacteroidota bacterium]
MKVRLYYALFLVIAFSACDRPSPSGQDWPVAGGHKGQDHYSTLNQITPANVARLEPAWTYHSGGADPDNLSQIQCNPIVMDGIMYGSTPTLNVFAIDAATGEERWRFDPSEGKGFQNFGMGLNRGVTYWSDGDEARIFCTEGYYLYALNALTGRPILSFGDSGMVDLHVGLGPKAMGSYLSSNSPGIIYQDLIIMGTRVSEGNDAAPGHIRAFDVRTGELAWIFHTIPQPGEPGIETWPEDAWNRIGGANAWAGMALDDERGIVFVPTGSASYDFYGGNRHGENLYANCLIALNAATGERIWHFQTVHHDLWDRDLPAPPNLVTVTHEGRKIEAVAQITKHAQVFLFDRETGEPLFPIEERPVPASDLPGEETWPTQPFPVKPPPFARQRLTEADLTDRTPEAHAAVLARFREVRSDGQFVPPSREGSVIFPGFDGGGEWGGAAFDPTNSTLYVNGSVMPWILTMVPVIREASSLLADQGKPLYLTACGTCHGADRLGGEFMGKVPSLLGLQERLPEDRADSVIRYGRGVMPGYGHLEDQQIEALLAYLYDKSDPAEVSLQREDDPYFIPYASTGYNRFLDPDGYPAVKPPWGTLTAIDLNAGEIRWQVPLGDMPDAYGPGAPPTGTENYGGPVVTAGGVLFIAATKDERFRAFDKETGELLWETELPAAGYATPATYEVGGRQFVVIACGGGKLGTKSGDAYLAFALPEEK